jgi:hypothetical protein
MVSSTQFADEVEAKSSRLARQLLEDNRSGEAGDVLHWSGSLTSRLRRLSASEPSDASSACAAAPEPTASEEDEGRCLGDLTLPTQLHLLELTVRLAELESRATIADEDKTGYLFGAAVLELESILRVKLRDYESEPPRS